LARNRRSLRGVGYRSFCCRRLLLVAWNRVTMETKPRLMTVEQPDADLIMSDNLSLGTPHIAYSSTTVNGKLISVTVDANHYRAWRKLRESQNQSDAEQK
jgi:hypothetical protein